MPPAKLHNSAALLLLLLLAGSGGDGGAWEAGDEDGAAGCTKRYAASLRQCVVPLSLKIYIKSNFREITYDHESVLRIRDVYPDFYPSRIPDPKTGRI